MAATLIVDVLTKVNTGAFDKAASSASTTGGRVKSVMKGVGGAIAGAFAAAKVVDFAKQSISAASDLNETMSKTQTVFGTSADAVVNWSKDSSNSLGLSQQAALDAASTFAVFGKSAGMTGSDLTGFSTDLTGLAADMASFSNTTPQEAVDALGAALRGETEPIRKYGVMLDANSVGLEAMRLGLSKSKTNLSAHAKVLATQSLILKQTKDAQGDFAKTSGGLANQQRILAAKLENTKASIGQALLPLVLQAATAFQTMATFVRQNSSWLVPLGAAIAVVAAALKVAAIAQRLFNVTLMTNPIFLVVTALVALGVGLVVAYKKCQTFRNIVNAVFNAVAGTVTRVAGVFKAAFTIIANAAAWVVGQVRKHWKLIFAILTGPIGLAVAAIIKYRDKIGAAFSNVAGAIRRTLSGVKDAITTPFVNAWTWIRDHVVSPMAKMFSGVTGAIRTALSGVKDAITGPFEAAWNWIQDHVLGPVKTAWNTVANAINSIHFSVTVPSNVITRATHIAGKGFTFDPPNIPTLASGAYVRRATLAMVGEGRGGEFVAPEAMLRRVVRDELGGRGAGQTIIVNVSGALDPDAVARQIERILRARRQRAGGVVRAGQSVALT